MTMDCTHMLRTRNMNQKGTAALIPSTYGRNGLDG